MLPQHQVCNQARRHPAKRLLPVGFLLLLPVCQPVPRSEPTPVSPAAATPEPEALVFETNLTHLNSSEAAGVAREIESEVPIEAADGLEVRLWAADPLIADPIALAIDNEGRVFVTQTKRSDSSDFDIRAHPDWMIRSITWETVEERRNFLHRELAPERSAENDWLADLNEDGSHDWRDLTVQNEQVYRLEDTSGDGVADLSRLVAEDPGTEVTDVALGLLAHQGDLYLGVAPDLWRLRDTDGDGVMDSREAISSGYGVHIGFGGHGMSGVTLGPDGRIYWAIGDIGLNVTDKEGRRWSYPNQGAILRSEPDGSNFEVFAAGLRNTHEFAFDEFGNLISVDNDGDHPGETERVVYIVDGSDSGWRTNWQFGKYIDPDNNAYKVWMEEEMYKPRFPGQAAYFMPPVASYHAGPSGMIYNPGTALSEKWRDHFFVSEFTGSPATSQVHAFRLEEEGAGFEMTRDTTLVRGILTTGIEVAPDGAIYLADWIEGWNTKGRGRIWKLDDPTTATSPVRAETKALLAADFSRRSPADLQQLLAHPDMRVRTKAQFALVDRRAGRNLLAAAEQTEHQLARLHGLWGIGQLARKDPRQAAHLTPFLRAGDAEVRAQAAKMIGDVRYEAAGSSLVPMLADPSARVRFFAAEALGRIRYRPAAQPILAMLEANNDEDVYLRHAGTLALARIGDAELVAALADHPSRALRIAAVVALRRMENPGVARFLEDEDEYIVAEAARAINDDNSIPAALPELARVLEQTRFESEPLLRRAINANLRVGTPEAAQRLAGYAARNQAPTPMRVEALAALGVWPDPSVLDRVTGDPRGPMPHDPTVARAALAPLVDPLLSADSAAIRVALAEAVGRLQLSAAAPALLARLRNDPAAEVRVAALQALHAMRAGSIETAVRTALADPEVEVRMSALTLVPALELPAATTSELLASPIGRQSVEEQQSALQALGALQSPEAYGVLGRLLDQMAQGKLPAEIQLDLVEAVEASNARELLTRLQQIQSARIAGNPLAEFGEALRGGTAARGQRVVFQNASAQCTRCHSFDEGGAVVGPNLRAIGSTLTREQLLEALVDPSARIAPGFGAPNSPSAMPPMGHLLSRREIRDVVEYLSTLKRTAP